jgi:hypothetical protein
LESAHNRWWILCASLSLDFEEVVMSILSNLLEDEQEETPPRPEIEGAILAIDVGNVHTRAILFDVVNGVYRFVARGEAPTTDMPPWNNVLIGAQKAVEAITVATSRTIMDADGEVITPEKDSFYGVGTVIITASAGQPVRGVLVGLMPDVSLISGRRAAESAYLLLVDTISLADRRTPEQQMEALLKARADLILIVGGTDDGAKESLRKNIETIALACSLMDPKQRPTVLYAGNQALAQEVYDRLDEVGMRIVLTQNVRPDLETERLDSAQRELAGLYNKQRSQTTVGFYTLGAWTDEGVFPTAHGFGRAVHVLGTLYKQNVLGIDLGSSDVTIAASIYDQRYLNVLDGIGMGHTITGVLDSLRLENLLRWLSFQPDSMDEITNYIWNKWLFPQTIPADSRSLEIEYSIAREVIRYAVLSARTSWRDVRQSGPLPLFDTILLSGSTLTRTPGYGWSTLIALDALLPMGMTRIMIDPYGVAAALGGLTPISPQAAMQVLDTGAFIDLGPVIAVAGRARRGEIVVRGSLTPDEGEPITFEVPYGSIKILPLPLDMEAELLIQPRNVEIEMARGKKLRRTRITGGALGVVIDARGRPWRFPKEPEERSKIIEEWHTTMSKGGGA